MNKTTALLATCALSLALAGCGGSGSSTSAPVDGGSGVGTDVETVEQIDGGETEEVEVEASLDAWTPAFDFSAAPTTDPVDVTTIDPGWLPEDNGDAGTSDIWYVNGQEGGVGIYFTQANNEAGLSVGYVDESKWDTDSVFHVVNQDNHLINEEGDFDEVTIDIVFLDNFNCYDYATGTWYSRGNQAYYEGLIVDRTLMADLGDGKTDSYELSADGTFLHDNTKYEPETGTWRICAVNVIELVYDRDGYRQLVRFESDADGNLTFLDFFKDYQLI